MRFIFVTVGKELKRRLNDPAGLISAIMIPFVIGFLMAADVFLLKKYAKAGVIDTTDSHQAV